MTLRLLFVKIPSDTVGVRSMLDEMCYLHSLEIRRGGSYNLLAILSGKDDDLICPLLERLVLEDFTGLYYQYRDLVETRWIIPTRRIRAITFRDCQIVGTPSRVGRLLNLPEANAYVQKGLILNICNTQGAIVN